MCSLSNPRTKMPFFNRRALLALALFGALRAQAAYTGADAAWDDWQSKRSIAASTADGRWRASLGADARVRLESADGAKRESHALKLPRITGLALSPNGQQVWVSAGDCLGRLNFQAPGLPSWQALNPAVCAQAYQGQGVFSLSPDARWLAAAVGETIEIWDLQQGRKIAELPAGSQAFALHFHAQSQQLLVLQQRLDNDASDAGSFLDASLWDWQRGLLLWSHRQAGVHLDAVGWSSASAQLLLWGAQRRLSPTSCESAPAWPGSPSPAGWPLAVDPHGRWLAVYQNAVGKQSAELRWLASSDGKLLGRQQLDAWPAWAQAGADGRSLLLGLAMLPPLEQHQRPVLQRWQVLTPPAKALSLAASAPKAASQQVCPLAQEFPGARQVKPGSATPRKLGTWSLATDRQLPSRQAGDERPANGPREFWGVDPDGQVWLDRGTRLLQLDASSGAVLNDWPTPRSAKVYSRASFARRQFLNWQGDTLSLRAFAPTLDSAARQVLVRRPGWLVQDARWQATNRLWAVWVERPQAGEPRAAKAQRVAYAIDAAGRAKPLATEDGDVLDGGQAFFASDEAETDRAEAWPPDNDFGRALRSVDAKLQPGLRWDWSFGGVRAWQGDRLLLWDEVNGNPARLSPSESNTQIFPFDGPWALAVALSDRGRRALLYRAEPGRPQRLAQWPLEPAAAPLVDAWRAPSGALWLERQDELQLWHVQASPP